MPSSIISLFPNKPERTVAIACFIILVVVSAWRLDRPVFWNDEADTIFMAKTIAQTGLPEAIDQRNAMIFKNCSQLSTTLFSKKIPWAQYYVAFASAKIFGDSTEGMRILFSLIGTLAFWPLGFLIRKRVNFPWPASAMLLLLPQTILFNRNARYYSLLNLEIFVLLWAVIGLESRPRKWIIAACSILLFQTHPLSAACSLAGVTLFYGLKRRDCFVIDLFWLWIGFPVWAVWYWSLTGFAADPIFLAMLWQTPALWLKKFMIGLIVAISDLDYVGVFPLIFWLALFAMMIFHEESRRRFWGDSLAVFAFCVSLCLIVAIPGIAGTEVGGNIAILRYMPQICILLPLMALLGLEALPPGASIAKKVGIVLLLFTNILSLGVFTRQTPFSWWTGVYREIFLGSPDTLMSAMDHLQAENAERADQVVRVDPSWMTPVFLVYLGRDFIIQPSMDKGTECAAAVEARIGAIRAQTLWQRPDFQVFLMPQKKVHPPGQWVSFPLYVHLPDASRPELTRHEFPSEKIEGYGGLLIHPHT
jgi:hypothetical protein